MTTTLVTKADRYEPLINRVAQDCARHCGTLILPARPRHPQDKALAEVGVQIVERWILARLRHRRFFSLAELNQAIRPLLDDLNHRPFKYCKVNIDYHVGIEGHYYSVPHSLVRQELGARITCSTVELLFRGNRVHAMPRMQSAVRTPRWANICQRHTARIWNGRPNACSTGDETLVRILIALSTRATNSKDAQKRPSIIAACWMQATRR